LAAQALVAVPEAKSVLVLAPGAVDAAVLLHRAEPGPDSQVHAVVPDIHKPTQIPEVEPEVQAEQLVAVVDGVKMAIQIRTPVLGPQAVLASAFAVHTSTQFLVAVAVLPEVHV
jgi:hypothetical protein